MSNITAVQEGEKDNRKVKSPLKPEKPHKRAQNRNNHEDLPTYSNSAHLVHKDEHVQQEVQTFDCQLKSTGQK